MRLPSAPFAPIARITPVATAAVRPTPSGKFLARMDSELSEREAASWLAERTAPPLSGASSLLYIEVESIGLDLDRLESSWTRAREPDREGESRQRKESRAFWESARTPSPRLPRCRCYKRRHRPPNLATSTSRTTFLQRRHTPWKSSRAWQISLASILQSAFAQAIAGLSGAQEFTLALASFDAADRDRRGARIADGTAIALIGIQMNTSNSFFERAMEISRAQATAHAFRSEGALTAARRAPGGNGYPVLFTDLLDAGGFISATSWLGTLQRTRMRTPHTWLDCQARRENGALCLSWNFPRGLFDGSRMRESFAAFIASIPTNL